VNNLVGYYDAAEIVGFDRFPEVGRVLDAFRARPAVTLGLQIPRAPAA
jgi:GST-like protein